VLQVALMVMFTWMLMNALNHQAIKLLSILAPVMVLSAVASGSHVWLWLYVGLVIGRVLRFAIEADFH
jgi:hypothetical protein